MSPLRPKNKFEYYFNSIGELSYLIVFCVAILFLIGFCAYQLYVGNFKWLKENPAIILVFILITAIGVSLLRNRKKG
jgi:hypothetical protein